MELRLTSEKMEDYLRDIPSIGGFNTPMIQSQIKQIEAKTSSKKERAKYAFELARDEIGHSFDTKEKEVTIEAEKVLKTKNGICFAKAHLLVSLLRGMDIPAGFCYQRVLRNPKDKDSGHALHGLNALYLEDVDWFRVDPRGNKPGVNAQFSIEQEQLAYPIREELGEKDYPYVFTNPLQSVLEAMRDSADSEELFYKRPEAI